MKTALLRLVLCAGIVCGTLYFFLDAPSPALLAAGALCVAAALLLDRLPGPYRESETDRALFRFTEAAAHFAAWIISLW